MRKIVKNIITLSIINALSLGAISYANAATYQLVDNGETTDQKYTYAQHQNENGDMSISGTSNYNFPVQFDYLDDVDFVSIQIFAANNYLSVHELDNIEDPEALVAGNPTANDLSWIVKWLKSTSSGKAYDIEYQKVGDVVAMTNISGITQNINLWDSTFEGTETLTRSTIDIISGITNTNIAYGTGTAPYLPSDVFTDSSDVEHTFWLREHGSRGFYSYDQGANIYEVTPIETQYGGGISALVDVNDAGVGVGYSSYKLYQTYSDFIENESGGCADTDIVPATMTLEACIGNALLGYTNSSISPYHNMAIKAILNANGSPAIEQLGLLVTPHEDDIRTYSSYALAINATGTAVGYADGFYDETVIEPSATETRAYQYAVVYKDGEVIDLSGEHEDRGTSIAYDINDAGIAVGHINEVVSGAFVSKFFYVDTNAPEEQIKMVMPDDFFSNSDSTARAINNSNLIVGEGEVETHNESTSNPRRTAAFVYDLNNDIFTNLNETIPCSLRLTYDIFEARGINDAGVISASAIIKVERKNSKGEVMLDETGTPLTEDVVRAISLEPTPDDSEVCSADEEEETISRQGASVSYQGLLIIMALFGLRRNLFN